MMEQEYIQLREEEDKSNLTYYDPHFIAVFGGLNEHNVMKYFSTSVFFDNKSLNALAEMQRLDIDKVINNAGKLYRLYKSDTWTDKKRNITHKLFLIAQYQVDPTQEDPALREVLTGMYYILNDVIFKSPFLLNVLRARSLETIKALQSSFNEVSNFIKFDPTTGYSWNYDHPKATTFRKARDEQKLKSREGILSMEKLQSITNIAKKKVKYQN